MNCQLKNFIQIDAQIVKSLRIYVQLLEFQNHKQQYNLTMKSAALTFKKNKFIGISKVTIVQIISYLFIALFLYAGVSKFLEFETFRSDLIKSPLTKSISTEVAIILPLTEIFVAIILFTTRFKKSGLQASIVLMFVFTLYVAYLLFFAPYTPCHCGGIFRELSWTGHLLFNIAFTLLAIAGTKLNKQISK